VKPWTLVALSLAMAPATRSWAERPLTLGEAQAEARAHAPDAAEVEAKLAAARRVAAPAGRIFRSDPVLRGQFEPGRAVGNDDERRWAVGLEWSIDVSGSWAPRGAAARANVAAAGFERDAGYAALDEAVAIAVAELAHRQRGLARTQSIAFLFDLAAQAAKRQLDIGQGNQLESDAAELDLRSARADIERARGELGRAQSRLARLLGRARGRGLQVADPAESAERPGGGEVDAVVSRDPRVRAVEAELVAARHAHRAANRSVLQPITLGAELGRAHQDIPAGSFDGVAGSGDLSARWIDWELMFSLAVPLPVFDRQVEARAESSAQATRAGARLRVVRAEVRAELDEAWASLDAAAGAHSALQDVPEIIEREFKLLEKALRAGAMDAVIRAQSLRRLEEAGQDHDRAVLDLRAARAAWIRRTSTGSRTR
jgi:cobalt-zinc-cadmium efflux system outer membrane protein